jgi:hypothetical protein
MSAPCRQAPDCPAGRRAARRRHSAGGQLSWLQYLARQPFNPVSVLGRGPASAFPAVERLQAFAFSDSTFDMGGQAPSSSIRSGPRRGNTAMCYTSCRICCSATN